MTGAAAYFRDVMASAVGCPPEALLNISASQHESVRQAAGQLGLETTLAVLQILDQTISRLKYLMYPRTLAEVALVRICALDNLDSLPQLIAQMREGGAAAPKSPASSATGARTMPTSPAPRPIPPVSPAGMWM